MVRAAPLRALADILSILRRLDTFLAPELARFYLIHQPCSLQVDEQGDNFIYWFRRKSRDIENRMLAISKQ